MIGKSFSKQTLYKALLLVVFASQLFHCNDAKNVHLDSTDGNTFLEYHFHTYFHVSDPVQVAQAIQLRNEIIEKCVAKEMVAVPLHYHYDPQNPVLERKFHNNI